MPPASNTWRRAEIPAAAGKFVSDPRCDAKDIEAVVALALKKDATLTPAHAEALHKLLDGPHHAVSGERIFNGIPFGSSIQSAHGHLYLFSWVFGAQKNTDEINFGADIDTYTAALAPWLNAENPDLSAFAKRGGKIVLSSGTADSVVPYHATLDYYERVIEQSWRTRKGAEFRALLHHPGHGSRRRRTGHQSVAESVRSGEELARKGRRADRTSGQARRQRQD